MCAQQRSHPCTCNQQGAHFPPAAGDWNDTDVCETQLLPPLLAMLATLSGELKSTCNACMVHTNDLAATMGDARLQPRAQRCDFQTCDICTGRLQRLDIGAPRELWVPMAAECVPLIGMCSSLQTLVLWQLPTKESRIGDAALTAMISQLSSLKVLCVPSKLCSCKGMSNFITGWLLTHC